MSNIFFAQGLWLRSPKDEAAWNLIFLDFVLRSLEDGAA